MDEYHDMLMFKFIPINDSKWNDFDDLNIVYAKFLFAFADQSFEFASFSNYIFVQYTLSRQKHLYSKIFDFPQYFFLLLIVCNIKILAFFLSIKRKRGTFFENKTLNSINEILIAYS